MMDLKARAEAMLGLPVGESTDMAMSVTGESYVEILSGGSWASGGRVPAWFATSEDAITAWLCEVAYYNTMVLQDGGREKVLYWRRPPEIESIKVRDANATNEMALYTVYSRLLISSRPRKRIAA